MSPRRIFGLILMAGASLIASALPISAQDAPLPLPYDGNAAGIINRAPFEVSPELLAQTRTSLSLTVNTFADPAVAACDVNNGVSLREAIVHCTTPTVQPTIYLPTGTYTLTSTIAVLERSFSVIGQNPLNTFIEGSPTNIRYFDIFISGTNTVTFANVTIRNSTSGLSGNALRIVGSGFARLENVRVTGNQNSTRGTVRFDIEPAVALSITIHHCEFSNNNATTGGAIALTNELGTGVGSLSIHNSLFSNNTVPSNGGALLVNSTNGDSTQVTISKTQMTGGTVASGGAIYMSGNGDSANLTLIDTTIDGNTATSAGAGIFFNNTGGEIVISDSTISNNTFVTSGAGGGLMVNAARHISISDSLFDDNDAKTGIGGALYFDSAVGQISLMNTTVSNNNASSVGGIYASLVDSMTANGLIVTGNTATSDVGGAMLVASNFVNLTDSSFTLNTAALELGGLATARASLLNVRIEDNTSPIRPDCMFSSLSGSSTSFGGLSITNMSGCDGTLISHESDLLGSLLKNGGFEFAGANPASPANWTLKTITGDKRACNTLTKTVTAYGKCAMTFKGGSGEKATLTQIVDLTGLTFAASEVLTVYAMGDGSAATSKLKITVTATYSDQPTNKTILNITGNHPTLTGQSQILTLTSASVTKITVQIQHTSPGGKFVLDRVYLTR